MVGGFALVYPLIEGRAAGLAGVVVRAARRRRRAARRRSARCRPRALRQGRTPLVEPSILRRRPYVAGLAVVVGFIGAMGGMMIALNVMYQTGLGFTPLACGVATVAIPLAAIGGSITSSALLARLGRTTMHIGIAVMAVGLGRRRSGAARRPAAASPPGSWPAPLALTGFGMGMVFVPMFDVILAGVAPAPARARPRACWSPCSSWRCRSGSPRSARSCSTRSAPASAPAAFVGAADHALLVAIGLLGPGWLATWWLPRHAARHAHG